MDFKDKYLKYKKKYIILKNLIGSGNPEKSRIFPNGYCH